MREEVGQQAGMGAWAAHEDIGAEDAPCTGLTGSEKQGFSLPTNEPHDGTWCCPREDSPAHRQVATDRHIRTFHISSQSEETGAL